MKTEKEIEEYIKRDWKKTGGNWINGCHEVLSRCS